MRVNFAPHCDRRVPHLRRANCGLAFLFGTKFPPQSATRCSCGYLRSKFQRWLPHLPCVNCGGDFLVRLKYARFSVFFRLPSTDDRLSTSGAGLPRGKTRRTGATGKTGFLFPLFLLFLLSLLSTLCSRVSFLIPVNKGRTIIFYFQFSIPKRLPSTPRKSSTVGSFIITRFWSSRR